MSPIEQPSHAFSKLLFRLVKVFGAVAVALLALVAILVVVQVVARNIFDLGLPWADEFARFSSMALVYLAIPLVAIKRMHVSVEILPSLLGPRSSAILALAVELGVTAFCLITLFGFERYLIRAGKFSTPAIGMSNWIFYAPAALGIALFLLVSATRAIDLAAQLRTESTK